MTTIPKMIWKNKIIFVTVEITLKHSKWHLSLMLRHCVFWFFSGVLYIKVGYSYPDDTNAKFWEQCVLSKGIFVFKKWYMNFFIIQFDHFADISPPCCLIKSLQACSFIKKRLQHRWYPAKFAKLLKTLQNTSGGYFRKFCCKTVFSDGLSSVVLLASWIMKPQAILSRPKPHSLVITWDRSYSKHIRLFWFYEIVPSIDLTWRQTLFKKIFVVFVRNF